MQNISKKILIPLTIFALTFAPLTLPSAHNPLGIKRAHAIPVTGVGGFFTSITTLPSIDGTIAAIAANTAITATEQTLETKRTWLDWLEEFVLETLKRRLLDAMVYDIINWINGGGEPRFITDWEQFLEDAANVAVGDFVQGIGAGFLCNAFSADLQLALTLPVQDFRQAYSCTLDDIVANVDAFFADFSQGGWIAYQAVLEPQNNFTGSYLLAREQINRRGSAAAEAARLEGLAGQGILSQYDCQGDAEGKTAADGADIDRDGLYGDVQSTCKITNPGTIIGDLVKDAVGVDFDFIVNAQQLSQYVAAITNALINRLLRVGVQGLAGLSSPSDRGPDFLPEQTCGGLIGEAFRACQDYLSGVGVGFETLRSRLETEINDSLLPRKEAQAIFEGTHNAWAEHLSFLEQEQEADPRCVDSSLITATLDVLQEISALMASNTTAILELETAKTTLQSVPERDWAAIISIQNSLPGVIDATAAENLKDESEVLETESETEIEAQEEEVNNCGGGGGGN